MRKLVVLLVPAFLALGAGSVATGGTAKTYTVKVGDDYFSPTKRTIHKNDVVKWIWVGEDKKPGETVNEHTITEAKDRFHSKAKRSGTYKVRFKGVGKFKVICAEHPDDMIIKITVKE
jgi:plastocyanin